MPRFDGVLLDVDATLVDGNDARAEAWISALRDHGIEVSFERIRALMGLGDSEMLRELVGLDPATDPKAGAIDDDRSHLFLDAFVPGLKPFDDARGLVERIKADGLRVIVLGPSRSEELDRLVEVAGVADRIDGRIAAGGVGSPGSDRSVIDRALESAGLAADRAVLIGDSPADVAAAARAGVAVIALRSGGRDDAELAGAIAIHDDVSDLLARYDGSPLARDRG